LQFDYTAVGHVTIDELPDGSSRAGGTAFYAALQAARLGLRALIVTQGVAAEIERLLEPYSGELSLRVVPARHTTTLRTRGIGLERRQRLLAWAGEMPSDLALDTAILHLAPVARETPWRWRGQAGLLGLTPQGLVRRWPAGGGEVQLAGGRVEQPQDDAIALAARCDALVLSDTERASCAQIIDAATAAGAAVAVTAGPGPTLLLRHSEQAQEVGVSALASTADDLGAGDVFAAAFFVMLHEGTRPETAAAFANAAAAVRMMAPGAQAIGGRDAIGERLRASAADVS